MLVLHWWGRMASNFFNYGAFDTAFGHAGRLAQSPAFRGLDGLSRQLATAADPMRRIAEQTQTAYAEPMRRIAEQAQTAYVEPMRRVVERAQEVVEGPARMLEQVSAALRTTDSRVQEVLRAMALTAPAYNLSPQPPVFRRGEVAELIRFMTGHLRTARPGDRRRRERRMYRLLYRAGQFAQRLFYSLSPPGLLAALRGLRRSQRGEARQLTYILTFASFRVAARDVDTEIMRHGPPVQVVVPRSCRGELLIST